MFYENRRINRPVGFLPHFVNPTFQFVTTVRGGEDAAAVFVVTRKSAVTSYWNGKKTPSAICVSNSGTGAPSRNEGLGSVTAFTSTAVIFPSAPAKNSSLPSPRQRGCSPPAVEPLHKPSEAGKGRTYTSRCPDSSEVYAIHRPSGEIWPWSSLNSVLRNGIGFRSDGMTH